MSGMSPINAACRLAARPFYAAGSFGMFGFIFADLISHTFVISRVQSNVPTQRGPETPTRTVLGSTTSRSSDGTVTELVTKREDYTPLLLANTSPLPPHQTASRRRKFAVSPILSCLRALWDYQSLTNKLYPSDSHEDIELFITLATNKHRELELPTETLRADIIRTFMQNLGAELSPVCAFLGGQLAQDVINVLSAKEQPIQNMLIFDAEESKGPIYALRTEMPPVLSSDPPMGNGFTVSDQVAMPPPATNSAGLTMPSVGMESAMAPSMVPTMGLQATPSLQDPSIAVTAAAASAVDADSMN